MNSNFLKFHQTLLINFYTILAKYASLSLHMQMQIAQCLREENSLRVPRQSCTESKSSFCSRSLLLLLLPPPSPHSSPFFLHFGKPRQERFRFNHIGLFIPRATFVLMDISIFPSPPLPLLSLLSPFNYVTTPRSFPESALSSSRPCTLDTRNNYNINYIIDISPSSLIHKFSYIP